MQLAIETTGRKGSIAILDGYTVISFAILPTEQRTAMVLAPEIQRLLSSVGIGRESVELISVAKGPGSFTGLRVGVTTAKTLSFAWQTPLVGVGSLAAIAAEAFRCHSSVDQLCIAIEAYRGQAYTANFSRSDFSDDRICGSNQRAVALDQKELSDNFASGPETVFASGDQKIFSEQARFLSRQCDAIGVGLLAFGLNQQGHHSDPMSLAPTYLKPSAAEENS